MGRGCNADKGFEQLPNTEVINCRAEEHGRQQTLQVQIPVKRLKKFGHHLQILFQLCRIASTDILAQLGVIERQVDTLGNVLPIDLLEECKALVIDIVNTLERVATTNREREGAHCNLQLLLNLLQELKRLLTGAVEFIHKDHHRGRAHTADIHQFASLALHTLRAVNHNDYSIYGGQRAVGILGKVLVTRGVENVDFRTLILELHNRSSHRDTPLSLNLHKVGGCGFLDFVALHSTRHVDSTTKKQQLLGECSLTRVRVRNNGERAPAFYFIY